MLLDLLRLFRRARPNRGAVPGSRPEPAAVPPRSAPCPSQQVLTGKCYVIDGDTIVIGGTHVRLAGIDAPELDQPWGQVAKSAMIRLCKGQAVTAEIRPGLTYGRIVARCVLPDGTDIAAALVEQGLALDWAKFSGGAYRALEPPGIRKKLWRVEAKHRGRLVSGKAG